MKKLNENKNELLESKSRRKVLKNIYTAPILTILGGLSIPMKSNADSGPPVGPPSWGGF